DIEIAIEEVHMIDVARGEYLAGMKSLFQIWLLRTHCRPHDESYACCKMSDAISSRVHFGTSLAIASMRVGSMMMTTSCSWKSLSSPLSLSKASKAEASIRQWPFGL